MRKFLTKIFLFFHPCLSNCISPLFPSCCRYRPTCSQYSLEAIRKYGPGKGLFLAIKRILRCNPYHAGGYDPVP